MNEFVKLTANDGQDLGAYVSRPDGRPVGAVVVVQEIFGVNSHIRSVADFFATQGYTAIAPALFDRIQPDVELGYDGEGWKEAVELLGKLKHETALLDVAAAYKFVEAEDHKGIGVVGFCFGGLMSWLAATRGDTVKMRPACCVGYYPGGVGSVATEEPNCPVMLHFGAADTHIGPEQREAVQAAHPEVEVFVYDGAEHGFNCDQRSSYNEAQSKIAMGRTLTFLKTHLA